MALPTERDIYGNPFYSKYLHKKKIQKNVEEDQNYTNIQTLSSVYSQDEFLIEQPKGLINLDVEEKTPTNKNLKGSKIYKHPRKAFWAPSDGVLGGDVKTIKIMLPKMNSIFKSVDKKGSLMIINDD